MACVKLYRGNWVADYYDQHKKRHIEQPQGPFENQAQAKRAAQQLLAKRTTEISSGVFTKERVTFEHAATSCLSSKVDVRESTRAGYEQIIHGYLIPYFGSRKLQSIQVHDVERFRADLSRGLPPSVQAAFVARQLAMRPGFQQVRAKEWAKGRKPGRRTINKALTVLTMVFNYAERNRWIEFNPGEHVAQLRDERTMEDRPLDLNILSPSDISALRDAADTFQHRDGELVQLNNRLVMMFAVFTGCRAGELLGAKWEDLDWKSGQFHVRRSYKNGKFHEPKTRTSYRRITLPKFLLSELKTWRLACPKGDHDLVFPNLTGGPMHYSNFIRRSFFPALRRAGLRKIRFHDLRHTFASLLISNGEDIVRVSRMLGHSNPAITLKVYSHLLPKEHDGSSDRLASLVFGNNLETSEAAEADGAAPPRSNVTQIKGLGFAG